MKQIVKYLFFMISVIVVITAIYYYRVIFSSNVILSSPENSYLYIHSDWKVDDVIRKLDSLDILEDKKSFLWVIAKKNYQNHVHPGKYKLENGMSNNALVNMLRSGRQEEVKVVFNNIRTVAELAGIISQQIEADSISIIELLNNEEYLSELGYDRYNIMSVFIPNTYKFYWNTDSKDFLARMMKEYERFWNDKRLKLLNVCKLSKYEVITLASIVEQETQMDDEKRRLAGVYINRLNKGIRLQADPTIKFALGNFEIKRILTEHLSVNSPYNTYKFKGLPPGPICLPSIKSIDAVLNFEKHSYLYFCAKDDFSGYHVFAKSLRQHNINARKYQKALNKNKVFK